MPSTHPGVLRCLLRGGRDGVETAVTPRHSPHGSPGAQGSFSFLLAGRGRPDHRISFDLGLAWTIPGGSQSMLAVRITDGRSYRASPTPMRWMRCVCLPDGRHHSVSRRRSAHRGRCYQTGRRVGSVGNHRGEPSPFAETKYSDAAKWFACSTTTRTRAAMDLEQARRAAWPRFSASASTVKSRGADRVSATGYPASRLRSMRCRL